MCFGTWIHQAFKRRAECWEHSQHYQPTVQLKRKVALGRKMSLIRGVVSLLFGNYELNNSYISSVSVTVPGQWRRIVWPLASGNWPLLKENELSVRGVGKFNIRYPTASPQNNIVRVYDVLKSSLLVKTDGSILGLSKGKHLQSAPPEYTYWKKPSS